MEGSKCEGWTLDGSYTVDTTKEGASRLTIETLLVSPDAEFLTKDWGSFWGFELPNGNDGTQIEASLVFKRGWLNAQPMSAMVPMTIQKIRDDPE